MRPSQTFTESPVIEGTETIWGSRRRTLLETFTESPVIEGTETPGSADGRERLRRIIGNLLPMELVIVDDRQANGSSTSWPTPMAPELGPCQPAATPSTRGPASCRTP